jgi:hypothetical protein
MGVSIFPFHWTDLDRAAERDVGAAYSKRGADPSGSVLPISPSRQDPLLLDQEHKRLGQHAVVSHGFSARRALHRGHQSVQIGYVHEHCDLATVLWVDKGPDVRHP